MSSTRRKNCCCTKNTCGYCNNYLTGKNCVDNDAHGNPDMLLLGQDCPDTEVMQICIDPIVWSASFDCPEGGDCGHPYYECCPPIDSIYPKVQKEFVIVKESTTPHGTNPCKYVNTEKIWVYGETDGDGLTKKCRADGLCNGTYPRCAESDVPVMDYYLDNIEVTITALCIEDEDQVEAHGYPIGTCGRLIEIQIRAYYGEGWCAGSQADDAIWSSASDRCDKDGDGVEELRDYRGGVGLDGWFFPSCGCLPYCWSIDEPECKECGEDSCFDNEILLSTPSNDILNRDRWCNARDCGCWGCLDFPAGLCGNEPETEYFTDICGRGGTHDRTGTDGGWIDLLLYAEFSCAGKTCGSQCCGSLGEDYTSNYWAQPKVAGSVCSVGVPPYQIAAISMNWRFVAT